jgi:hypothetical protein
MKLHTQITLLGIPTLLLLLSGCSKSDVTPPQVPLSSIQNLPALTNAIQATISEPIFSIAAVNGDAKNLSVMTGADRAQHRYMAAWDGTAWQITSLNRGR